MLSVSHRPKSFRSSHQSTNQNGIGSSRSLTRFILLSPNRLREPSPMKSKRLIGSDSGLAFVRQGFSMLIWLSAALKELGKQPASLMDLRWKFSIWPCPFIRSSNLPALLHDLFRKLNSKHRRTGSQAHSEKLLC